MATCILSIGVKNPDISWVDIVYMEDSNKVREAFAVRLLIRMIVAESPMTNNENEDITSRTEPEGTILWANCNRNMV